MKVLIADDSASINCCFKLLLEHLGYSVIQAYTGTDALVAFYKDKPDVILLDYRLPDMSGLTVLRKINDDLADTKVIIITADITSRVDQIVSEEKLNAEVLFKPVDVDVLRFKLLRKATQTSLAYLKTMFGFKPKKASTP